MLEDWSRVQVGFVSLDLPATLAARGTPIDSASAVFEGGGIQVIVDQGPFAPSLEANGRSRSEEAVEVSGSPAVMLTYDEGEVSVVAIVMSAPHRLTVVVRVNRTVPRQLQLEIIRTLRLVDAPTVEGEADA